MSRRSYGTTPPPLTPRLGSIIWRQARQAARSSTVYRCPGGNRLNHARITRVRTSYITLLTMRTVVRANYLNFWLSEKKDYHGGQPSGSPVTGHYTQIVWNTTRSVGCGIAVLPPSIVPNGGDVMSCRFYPAGNLPRPPY